MAEHIVSLGCDTASQVAFDEDIADILRRDDTVFDDLEVMDWTASQGETLMDSQEDPFLLVAARRADLQEGNPNSAKVLDATVGEFYTDRSLVKIPSRGRKGSKVNPKNMSFEAMLKKKRSVITIKNRDELCCARAIVSIKARVDQDRQYPIISRGQPIQGNLARQLHQEAIVPEGSCGPEELQKFQDYLGDEYQIIVIEGLKGHIIFKEREYDFAPKTIALLKNGNDFHGITSIPGFLNRSYFCRHCEKCYSNEARHNCVRRRK